jgi:hypothetical protein
MRPFRVVVLTVLLALTITGCAPARDDTGPGQEARQRTVAALKAGHMAVEGPGYRVLTNVPLVVFFQVYSGFGPDGYCGYEYADTPDSLVPDPLGSGHGEPQAIGGGWYWLCAH